MIFVTTYKVKPHITKEETKELMAVFATVGNTPGTVANYINADGGGGIVIAESDDPKEQYANLLNYGQWMEFDTKVMLKVEDAVPLIGAYLG
jgi:membrane protein YqaA with SNARE-associated domain